MTDNLISFFHRKKTPEIKGGLGLLLGCMDACCTLRELGRGWVKVCLQHDSLLSEKPSPGGHCQGSRKTEEWWPLGLREVVGVVHKPNEQRARAAAEESRV